MTASVRVATCSLEKMFARWPCTVRSLMLSCAAIALLVYPRAASFSTSISRAVSDSAGLAAACLVSWVISLRAMFGSRADLPSCTSRTARTISSASAVLST